MEYENPTRRDFVRTALGLAAAAYLPQGLEALADEKSKYKTTDSNFSRDSDEVLLARMIFGEARDRRELEQVAVAYTAINRVNDGKKGNGETLKEVILKPNQYSCFNKKDNNKEKLMDPEKYEPEAFYRCLEVARKVLNGKYSDPTNGATFYYNPEAKIYNPKTKKFEKIRPPKWTKNAQKIGRIKVSDKEHSKHEFYREN